MAHLKIKKMNLTSHVLCDYNCGWAYLKLNVSASGRVETESGGTRKRTGGEMKGEKANGGGSQQSCPVSDTVYPALLPLMRTPRLPAADWTDTPADKNGLARFAERPNLVSARVPPHSIFTLPQSTYQYVIPGIYDSRLLPRSGWELRSSGLLRSEWLDSLPFLDSWPLKMGPIRRPETSVRNYHYSLRNNPDERSSLRTKKHSIYNTLQYVATPCNRLRTPRTLTTS